MARKKKEQEYQIEDEDQSVGISIEEEKPVEKTYNIIEACSIFKLGRIMTFVVKKKFINKQLTEKEWDSVFKENRII